jgi:hypothetical protein
MYVCMYVCKYRRNNALCKAVSKNGMTCDACMDAKSVLQRHDTSWEWNGQSTGRALIHAFDTPRGRKRRGLSGRKQSRIRNGLPSSMEGAVAYNWYQTG